MTERFQQIRVLEAVLFASSEPLTLRDLAHHLPEDADIEPLLEELSSLYANRGINLRRNGERWSFRTAPDLAPELKIERAVTRKVSRVALETLAIIAYHQPVTRAEIEEIRGVALSRGTLDTLLEIGWIAPRGRRRSPGKPVTWGVTPAFLDHFGLQSEKDLPGLEDLKAAGLLDTRPALTALGGGAAVAEDRAEDEDTDDEWSGEPALEEVPEEEAPGEEAPSEAESGPPEEEEFPEEEEDPRRDTLSVHERD